MDEIDLDSEIFNSSDPNTILRVILNVIGVEELSKWRLVNKFCNRLAVQQMHKRNVAVAIHNDEEIDTFIAVMTNRHQPIPFRSYSLALGSISSGQIERFLEIVGVKGVDRFKFYDFLPDWDPYELLFFPQDIQTGFREKEIQKKILSLLRATANNLTELQINADADLPLTSHELISFPTLFPKLSKLVIDYVCVFAEDPNDVVSLVIFRAPNLKDLGIKVWDGPNSHFNSKIPGYLYDPPRVHPPKLTLGTEITSQDREMVDSLIRHAYSDFTHFVLCFMNDETDVAFWNGVKPLLALQSNLETLFVQSFTRPGLFKTPMQIPPLNKLRFLLISLLYLEESSPIRPFTQGQFPLLEDLSLFGTYSCEYCWMKDVVIPTLKRLVVWDYQGPASDETWHLSFPQLRALEVEVSPVGLSFLEYAFTHLTGLEILEVGSSLSTSGLGMQLDLWKLYTGTTEDISQEILKFWENGEEVTPLVEPIATEMVPHGVHGIYPVASLANFKNLKELKIWARTRLEIAALVFMSRPGGLPVLDKLILGYRPVEADDESDVDTVPSEISEVTGIQFRQEGLPSEQSEVTTVSEAEVYTEYLNAVVEQLEENAAEDQAEIDDWWGDDENDAEFRITLGLGPPHSVLPHAVNNDESGVRTRAQDAMKNVSLHVMAIFAQSSKFLMG